MNSAIITAVLVLGIIAVIECVSLFCKRESKGEELTFAVVVPVFPKDENLGVQLAYLESRIITGGCYGEEIILIDYGATPYQKELCRRFCNENGNAVITDPAGLEKILLKTFAIGSKI